MRIKALKIIRVGNTTLKRHGSMTVTANQGADLVKRGLAREVKAPAKPRKQAAGGGGSGGNE